LGGEIQGRMGGEGLRLGNEVEEGGWTGGRNKRKTTVGVGGERIGARKGRGSRRKREGGAER